MRVPPPGVVESRIVHRVLSGYNVVGTVRHASSSGPDDTTSHIRPHRIIPWALRPGSGRHLRGRGTVEPRRLDALVAPLPLRT